MGFSWEGWISYRLSLRHSLFLEHFLSLFGKNILRDEVTVRNSALIRLTLRKNRQILERSKTAQDDDPMQIFDKFINIILKRLWN